MDDIGSISADRRSTIREVMAMLDRSGFGLVLLNDAAGRFERTVTDGDLRRLLLAGADLDDRLTNLPALASLVAGEGVSIRAALELMDERAVNHLPVLDGGGRVMRVIERKELGKPILLSTPHMGAAERDFIDDAFRTNWIAPLGPNVDAFEREMADMVGVKHAAAVSSGTAAIHLGLRLVGVGPGDRVFCSTLTFAASANPIAYQGAEPVFIDSEPDSWNMSPAALQHAFEVAEREGWRPAAVIIVDLYGQSADMDPLLAICERYATPVIEDAAESLGARYKGRSSGAFGLMGVYSFNGNKIITTSGGGMLLSDDETLIDKARFLSTQARDPALHYEHSEIGFNYRMSNILAGVGRGQLQVLGERVERRRAIFEAYRSRIPADRGLVWMPEPEGSYSTRWLTACTLDPALTELTALEFIGRLAEAMIEARPIWKPMHLQPVFRASRYFTDGNASVSDRLYQTGVCLPSGSNMSDADLDRIIGTINAILAHA